MADQGLLDSGTSMTVGIFTLLRANGRIFYMKVDADGNPVYAANTGPTGGNLFSMNLGAMSVAPETDELFLGGGCDSRWQQL